MKKLALALPLTLLVSGVAVHASATEIPLTTPLATAPTGTPAQQFQAFVASAPATTTFVIPPQMNIAPPLSTDEMVTAAYWPYVNDITVTRNNTVGIFGSILAGAGNNVGGGANMPTPTPNLNKPQPQWESDRYVIGSCGEWVYKKYHDYQWFQSAAASCGGNGDCVYGVWASTTAPGEDRTMGALSAIQTQMSPYPSSSLDPIVGAPPGNQPSSTQPKNPFMSSSNQSVFAQALTWATSADTNTTDLANIAAVQEYLASSAFQAYQSQPYEIAGPRSAWHQQMHDQQAALGVNASDRALAQDRIQNMQNLVNAFLQAQANYSSAYEFWEAAIERACGGLFQRITPCTPTDPCPPTPPPSAACIAVRKEVPSATAVEDASIALSQAVIDEYLMADRITGVVDHGCLGTTENKCDWTPDMITAEYLTTLDADMASDLAYCDSIIGKQPTSVADIPGYENSTTDEYYFGLGLDGIVATATSFEQSETWAPTTTEPNTIHKDMFGGPTSWTIGGSTAGATYSQDGYWELRGQNNPSNSELCYLAGRAYAGALATVTLFGSSSTILDVDAQIAVGEQLLPQTSPMEAGAPETQSDDFSGVGVESHMTVFGVPIFNVSQTQSGTLSVPLVSQQYSVTVLDVNGELGPFSLSLSAQLQASINGTLTATPPPPCTSTSTEAQLAYALGINATPTFSAVAVGTALVGVAGTGVGIQGKIDIISISTPVNVSSALATGSNGTNMTLTETASVDMSVLGGELDAAECLADQCATQQIFSWNGIPVMNDVIWNDTQTIPLPSLAYAFNAGL